MNTETRTCQNCKQPFVIEPDDFAFYERLEIPPPTWCFMCRVVRRMCFRNERTLYKRRCDALGHNEELISIFSPGNTQRVYDHAAWWGDGWDPLTYGRGIDFSRPFLEQVKELWKEVPDVALMNINPVNSEYCSITEGNKNCYLVFGGDFNENTSYSTYAFNSKECMDTYWVSKSEYNYETVDCISCVRLLWSRYCEGCYDSAFLFNCRNCHDCFGCSNLSNQSFQIFNAQYSKDGYFEKLKEFDFSDHRKLSEIKEQFNTHKLGYPCRFAHIIHSTNSTGDNLEDSKNCRQCFDIFGGGEDCARVWLAYSKIKDILDCDRVGLNTELAVDCSTLYPGSKIYFSRFIFEAHDIHYSYNIHNAAYLFGCVGVRGKQYCILNKQYTKEEYEVLVPKIREHMNAMPYADVKGRVYKYGEFFPPEFSPFAYNETVAQELVTLTEEEVRERGYVWRKVEERNYSVTMKPDTIPSSISEVSDSILTEVIGCEHEGACAEQCATAFRITPSELAFYRKMKIPLPHLCPSCRHFQRVKQRNPLILWERSCECAGGFSGKGNYKNAVAHSHGVEKCPNKFQTTYSPDRPEIVYCESCYQAEVV